MSPILSDQVSGMVLTYNRAERIYACNSLSLVGVDLSNLIY